MEIIRLKDTVNPVLPASVATIGFFDGVHRGHQFLIRQVRQEAQASGLSSMVITFDQHPRQVLAQAYQPHLLTTLDEKLRRLSMTDIDYVVVLHFDSDMASLSAFDFMRTVPRPVACASVGDRLRQPFRSPFRPCQVRGFRRLRTLW